jgi:hypothetical protein
MTKWLRALRYDSGSIRRTRNGCEIKVLKLSKARVSTASASSAFSALFLSGCVVGPNYKRPLVKALGARWGREYSRPKVSVTTLAGRSKNG